MALKVGKCFTSSQVALFYGPTWKTYWNRDCLVGHNFILSATVKFRYSEKATKFWKANSSKFGRLFFQILWPSHNIWTSLTKKKCTCWDLAIFCVVALIAEVEASRTCSNWSLEVNENWPNFFQTSKSAWSPPKSSTVRASMRLFKQRQALVYRRVIF